jgi:pimeloyl-ACP methyl ester carboxylesterase
LGGIVTLFAAAQRPDLFQAVVLLDPVILPRMRLARLWMLRALGREERLPLVQGALRRRRSWSSRQACFDHFRAKPLFRDWGDEALWAYVHAGTIHSGTGGVELAYPPEWEAQIFASSLNGVWRSLPLLRVDALVMRGERSDIFTVSVQERVARLLPAAEFKTVSNAGHLFPMERPRETAAVILRHLAAVGQLEASLARPTTGAKRSRTGP